MSYHISYQIGFVAVTANRNYLYVKCPYRRFSAVACIAVIFIMFCLNIVRLSTASLCGAQ
jgi:hypothetical protein